MTEETDGGRVERLVRWPCSKITVSALVVSTEITEEDEGDPRMIEVQLSRESPGLIVLRGITRSDQSIAFFVEQWAALRKAIDTIAALAETNANLFDSGVDKQDT